MKDVAGEELVVNEDLIDRGNPTNDSRIVSEELGSTGFGKPNMRDVAGDISTGSNTSNIMESLISGSDIPDRNRGMEVNENFIDRGDPMNDIRVVSEEQGLVGGIPDRNRGQIPSSKTPAGITAVNNFSRPNMADIAGPIGFKGAPIDMQQTVVDGRPVDENDIEGIVKLYLHHLMFLLDSLKIQKA
jgi:hypothetical protein